VNASVIGQKCTIGAGSTIKDSYIFDNAVIGANCTVERSIIGAAVVIKDGSHIPKGCLIADGVVLGPNAVLQPFERLSAQRNDADVEADADDDDSDIEEVESSACPSFLFLNARHNAQLTRLSFFSVSHDMLIFGSNSIFHFLQQIKHQ